MQKTETGLENQLIDLYGQLLLDTNLVFAILLAWAVTHFIKQSPWITKKRAANRRWTIRVISAIVGFGAVVFFKRNLLETNLDHVINFGIIVAFTHPVLYRALTAVLAKVSPGAAEALKGK